MKSLTIALVLLSSYTLFGQIKFTDKTFDNGMRVPVAHMSTNPVIADSINAALERNLTDAEQSDFCIGDYGYFQKGNHIELHLVCNCMDFAETEHRYLFFSLETGQIVSYSDLFESNKKEEVLSFINKKIRKSADTPCKAEFGAMESDLSWEEITFRLYKDGLEIHPMEGACKSPVKIAWTELSSFLRYSFL